MNKFNRLIEGDALSVLRTLDSESVQCCVTSPPYYHMRNYQTLPLVFGGDSTCSHTWGEELVFRERGTPHGPNAQVGNTLMQMTGVESNNGCFCLKCEAWKGNLGSEAHPLQFVSHLVEIFSEVRRVLRKDGTLWLNLGDSYSSGGMGSGGEKQSTNRGTRDSSRKVAPKGFKPKDMLGIPFRVAFALQDAGWYLRQDIVWSKRNCIPESVKDRCVRSHEYIFLLSKSKNYYFDYDAIRENQTKSTISRAKHKWKGRTDAFAGARGAGTFKKCVGAIGDTKLIPKDGLRSKRSVWSVSTKPLKEAHFATFPPDLIRPCILAGSPKGGLVLDPFFGAGTTGVVCIEEFRKYLGIELNSKYCEIANKRLSETVAQHKLF